MAATPPRMQVGCDLVDVARFTAAMARRAGMRDRVFSAVEQADAQRGDVEAGSSVELERLAARFAAKEAARKALGDLRLGLTAVEVRCADDGAPQLYLHGAPSTLSVSLSHDAGMAMAVVVGPPPGGEPPPDAEPRADADLPESRPT